MVLVVVPDLCISIGLLQLNIRDVVRKTKNRARGGDSHCNKGCSASRSS